MLTNTTLTNIKPEDALYKATDRDDLSGSDRAQSRRAINTGSIAGASR